MSGCIKSKLKCLLFFTLSLLLCSCRSIRHANGVKNTKASATYELAENWPALPEGFVLGNPAGMGVDTAQNIFMFSRAGRKWPLLKPMPKSLIAANTIHMLDRQSGKIIRSWGAHLFIMPHGLTVDRNNNIWVTDVGLHQIFKFTHEGTLLLTLGEANVAGNDSLHFNRPTDVAVAPDGSFYVSDGYRNSRILKFSATGTYLFEWGYKGKKPGAFRIPHSIALDDSGNVYVADRENKRVQTFDAQGNFLQQWTNNRFGKLYAVAYDKHAHHLVAVDYVTNYIKPKGSDVIVFESSGTVISMFGKSGFYNGPVCRYHDVTIDNEGSIYVGDIRGNRIQKFKKVLY